MSSTAAPTELTLQEVAHVAGYHYAYVRFVVSKSRLPSVKRGKRRYVRVSDLIKYVRAKNPTRVPYVQARLQTTASPAVVEDTAA